jgi:putative tricarboxylic transport membrane protein
MRVSPIGNRASVPGLSVPGVAVTQPDSPATAEADRPVAKSRNVDLIVSFLLLALAALLGWDSWRTGAGWASDGPQAGYFPFYLSLLMGAASVYGIVTKLIESSEEPFVTRQQFERVMKVFVPTLAYCILIQYLGLYVASFLLVAGFMWWVGRIAAWKSLLTAFVFTAAMFLTFEIAFNVIMPKGPLEAAFGF